MTNLYIATLIVCIILIFMAYWIGIETKETQNKLKIIRQSLKSKNKQDNCS